MKILDHKYTSEQHYIFETLYKSGISIAEITVKMNLKDIQISRLKHIYLDKLNHKKGIIHKTNAKPVYVNPYNDLLIEPKNFNYIPFATDERRIKNYNLNFNK